MGRLQLQSFLEALTTPDKVYFQPPASLQMVYPCIVYQRDYRKTQFADNSPYRHTPRYQVTAISRTPDNPVLEKLATIPMCVQVRTFFANGLNHDVFELYF